MNSKRLEMIQSGNFICLFSGTHPLLYVYPYSQTMDEEVNRSKIERKRKPEGR